MNGPLSLLVLLTAAAEPPEAMHWTADGKSFVYLLQYRLFSRHYNPDGNGMTQGNTPEYSIAHSYGLIQRLELLTGKISAAARSDLYDCKELEGSPRTLEARVRDCEKSMTADRARWDADVVKVRGPGATPASQALVPPSGRATFEASAKYSGKPREPLRLLPFDGGASLERNPYGAPDDLELKLVTQGRPDKVWAKPGLLTFSDLRAFWSADEQWVALIIGRKEPHEHNSVVALPGIAKVELLDAGAGARTDELARRLAAANYAPSHQGKAKNVRPKTAIFVPPGFEPDGHAIADALGLSHDAVSPLMWSTPYAVTVAVGTDLAK